VPAVNGWRWCSATWRVTAYYWSQVLCVFVFTCRPRKGFWRRNFKRGHFAFHDTTLDIYHSAADMSANRSPASSINIQGLSHWILSGAPFIVWVQTVLLCVLELKNDAEFCPFFFSAEVEKLRFFYMCAKMKLPEAN